MEVEEAADGAAVAEEAAGFAGFGIAADVGGDGFVEAVEQDFDAAGAVVRCATHSHASVGRAEDVGGKEATEAADVEMFLAEIARGNANKTLLVHRVASDARVWVHPRVILAGIVGL